MVMIIQKVPCYEMPPLTLFQDNFENSQKDWFIRGSGGECTYNLSAVPTGVEIRYTAEKTRPIADAISEISKTFGLDKTGVAEICHVSRKTIYNWINHGKSGVSKRNWLRKSNTRRVFDILVAAKACSDRGVFFDKVDIENPLLNGKSLKFVLSQDKIDLEQVIFIGTQLKMIHSFENTIPNPFAS